MVAQSVSLRQNGEANQSNESEKSIRGSSSDSNKTEKLMQNMNMISNNSFNLKKTPKKSIGSRNSMERSSKLRINQARQKSPQSEECLFDDTEEHTNLNNRMKDVMRVFSTDLFQDKRRFQN